MKSSLVLFGVFCALVAGAYVWSSRRYSAGEGLEKSVLAEVLLQYQPVANASLKVDVQPVVQAERIPYGVEARARFKFSNLLDETRHFTLRLEVLPAGNAEAFQWSELGTQTLRPKEQKILEIPFILQKDKTYTSDGTLSLKLSLQPAP